MVESKRKFLFLLIGLFAVKWLLSGLFSSDYIDQLFLPFAIQAWSVWDPWMFFYEQGKDVAFPYPPVMLWITMPFAGIIDWLSIESPFLTSLIFKIPILIADIVATLALFKLFPVNKKAVVVFYTLSPIVYYASFAHGQLDLIPTSLLLVSLCYFTERKFGRGFGFVGLAMATKFHVVVVLPVLAVFYLKRRSANQQKKKLLVPLAVFFALISPYIGSTGFLQMVFNNPEQGLIYRTYFSIGELKLYYVPAAFILLYSVFLSFNRINKALLISYIGVIFATLVLLVVPTPGWYVWSIPFLAIVHFKNFYRDRRIAIALHLLMSAAYLLYFVIFYQHPINDLVSLKFLGTPVLLAASMPENLVSLSFSTLQTLYFLNFLALYRLGIRSNSLYQHQFRSTLIGIAGDSASGKTTLKEDISAVIGNNRVLALEGDGEHRWERNNKNWSEVTHLNPKANRLYDQLNYLKDLRNGDAVYRSDYDHESGKFSPAERIQPKDYVLLSGLHPFYLPRARKLFDIRIFLDIDENLRRHRKVIRDQKKRGYTKEQVYRQIEKRAEDREKHILPQKEFADISISYQTMEDFVIGGPESPKTQLMVEMDSNIDLDRFMDKAKCCKELVLEHEFTENLSKQILKLRGDASPEEIGLWAKETIKDLDDFEFEGLVWKSGLEGTVQLVISLFIAEHLRGASV